MAEYALNTFLRQTPKATLAEYFSRRGVLKEVDFASLKKTEYAPILAALERLEPAVRAQIERDFQEIALLANRSGVQIILDEAQLLGLDLADTFAGLENHYHRAMWLFLNRESLPKGFYESCVSLAKASTAKFHPARRLTGLPMRVPAHDPATLQGMANALRAFYRPQGRGQRCTVEHNVQPNPMRHTYVAYPEDYATTDLEYEEDALQQRGRRSVFQIVFTYFADRGVLEVGARANKVQARVLQEIFCRYALGLERLPKPEGDRSFRLNGLKQRNCPLPTDPAEGISQVEVLRLELKQVGRPNKKVRFEVGAKDVDTVYDLLDEWTEGRPTLLRMMDVCHTKMRITWNGDGNRARTRTFTLTTPDGISPRECRESEEIRRCLKSWGLMP